MRRYSSRSSGGMLTNHRWSVDTTAPQGVPIRGIPIEVVVLPLLVDCTRVAWTGNTNELFVVPCYTYAVIWGHMPYAHKSSQICDSMSWQNEDIDKEESFKEWTQVVAAKSAWSSEEV